MKRKKIMKLTALAMMFSTTAGILNSAGIVNTFAAEGDKQTIYSNDFSKNSKPSEVNGAVNKGNIGIEEVDSDRALAVDSKFTGTADWGSNRHEFTFQASSSETLAAGATVEFDILIPEDQADFEGNFRFKAGLSDKNWNWVESGESRISASDFKDEGNGYLRATVKADVTSECEGLQKLTLQLSSENCSYTGKFYIDNLKLSADVKKADVPDEDKDTEIKENEIQSNDFSKEENIPDRVEGSISNSNVSLEEVDGDSALKVETSFDGTSDEGKNKHEFTFDVNSDDEISGDIAAKFDVIIPKDQADFDGTMRYNVGINDSNWQWISSEFGNLTADQFEDMGNGYLKAQVTAKFNEQTIAGIKSMSIQLVGQNCDYKDDLYIDNFKLVKFEKVKIEKPEEDYNWTFDESDEGWKYEGSWAYHGTEEVDYSEEMQALRLGVDYTADADSSWSEFKVKTDFSKPADLLEYDTFSFDFIYNPDNMTSGCFKAKLFIPDGPAQDVDINTDDAEDLGNGLKKAKVTIKFDPADVKAESATIGIVGYKNDYKGDLYLDNIKLSDSRKMDAKLKWTFDESDEGWGFGGSWAYNGTEEVDYSEENQALRLGLDYSNDSASSWSEFKINKNLDEPVNLAGCNTLQFDFIYKPEAMTTGSFKAKLFIPDGPDVALDMDLSEAEDLGNGYSKAKITVDFDAVDVDAESVTIGIVGYMNDYKGDAFIDNIAIGTVNKGDVYVNKTVDAEEQKKLSLSDLDMQKEVTLADENATESTADLYAYLQAVGKTENVIYGHQNDTHHKAINKNGTNSDTKDMTGSISGMTGIDTLSLTGSELELTDEEKAAGLTYAKKAAQIGVAAHKEGSITTMSAHMPNFALVAEKGKDAEGNYDFSGYTPNITSGDVANRILPGGDLNEVYNQYLDLIAEYADNMVDENGDKIPVLFRPFHENNGSWFWWGAAFCDAQTYKNLYAYTEDYLKNEKDVHNFLYVYSPNGPFNDADEYLSRYPGDEYVDVIAFDMYDDNPAEGDNSWKEAFKETIDLVQGIANERGKVSAVAETGLRMGNGGLLIKDNTDKDWFKDVNDIVSESDMPYFMAWANFNNTDNFFQPFMVDDKKGHEMVDNFVNFYNDDKSIFADGQAAYTDAVTTTAKKGTYGYITTVIPGNKLSKPITLNGIVRNAEDDVKFVIKNKQGEVVDELAAVKDGDKYSAELTQEVLDKAGATFGSIELVSGDKTVSKIKAIFNYVEREKDPALGDDFEDYLGDKDILTGTWSKSYGAGCNVNPNLSDEFKGNGDYGLEFNYKITTAKSDEGWAGITKPMNADWSDKDALQLWVKPDGKGQKLIIQITSNGEDFEVNLSEFAKTTEAKLLTIPFSEFKGKNGGKLDLSKIEKMGIWCNTIVPEGEDKKNWTVDSTMYFDDIKAVKTDK